MDNIAMIFQQYVKNLKMTANEQYIYIVRDDFFGDIVFTVNSTSLSFVRCPELSDKYFGKMIDIDCIKKKIVGVETEIGVLSDASFITQYNCREKLIKNMKIFNQFKLDIQTCDRVRQRCSIQTSDEDFFNNILTRKSDEGAGRYIFENDNIMYVAPCMFPGSKTTSIDATSYYKTGNDYYVMMFITHKKTGDVATLMRFLCL